MTFLLHIFPILLGKLAKADGNNMIGQLNSNVKKYHKYTVQIEPFCSNHCWSKNNKIIYILFDRLKKVLTFKCRCFHLLGFIDIGGFQR